MSVKFEEIMSKLSILSKSDATVEMDAEEQVIRYSLHDSAGFDDKWEMLYRKLDDASAVKAVEDWLYDACDEYDDCGYMEFLFGDWIVEMWHDSGIAKIFKKPIDKRV